MWTVTEFDTEFIDTEVACSACGQRIAVVRDRRNGSTYTECGGEGEGWCSDALGGDAQHGRSHALAIRSVTAEV